jgi:hypothetical protein
MQMQQMMAPGMLQSLLPMNPLQQAQAGYYNARADTEAREAGILSPTQQLAKNKLDAQNIILDMPPGPQRDAAVKSYRETFGTAPIFMGPGPEMTDKQKVEVALSLKTDFNARPAVKEFHTLRKNASRMEIAYQRSIRGTPNAANDQVLINTFNKMLDELSVVRESEYARTGAGLSALNRMRGYWDKIKGGGAGLTPEDRQDIYDISQDFLDVGRQMFDEVYYDIDTTAEAAGVDKRIIFGGRKPFVSRQPQRATPSAQREQAFAPITETVLPERTIALDRARRRLGPNATKEQIMQLAARLLEAERSGRNPLRRANVPQGVR